MEVQLNTLRPGQQAVVERLDLPPELEKRLQDFGMVPGTKVRCKYRSPWGDVTALELRGTVLALRTGDLKCIKVRLV